MRVAVLTISDAGARGQRADTSGDAIVAWCAARGYEVSVRDIIPDESAAIVARLVEWCDRDAAELILTTGGTGLSPRDITPEAPRPAIKPGAQGTAEPTAFLP